jgi:metal-responsive CopG/Arc/MetJ family transcriptional regulator
VSEQRQIDKKRVFQQSEIMKTTIDLPEQMMNEVESLAAREQREVGEVVADLVRIGLENRSHQNGKRESPSESE